MENRRYKLSSMQTIEKDNSRFTAWGMVIIFLIVFILNTINQFGGIGGPLLLLYIPVFLSTYIFGLKGGLATAIFAGISVRPFIILNSLLNETQKPSLWITQTLMLIITAVIFSEIIICYNNYKKLLKAKSYRTIQTRFSESQLNSRNIITIIKYRNGSFRMLEYKKFDIINKCINYMSGKKAYELIIIKYDE